MRPGPIIATAVCVSLALVALALGVFALPTRLTVAVGPDDREHVRVMAAFARKLQDDHAPLRLTLVRKPSYTALAAALDAGEVDLAVVRSDVMPRQGLTVVVLNEMPMLFFPAAGVPVRSLAQMPGRRVGVLRGTPENMALLDLVLRQAGVEPQRVTRIALDADATPEAIAARRLDVLMPLGALQGQSLTRLLALGAAGGRAPVVFGVDEAEVVAAAEPTLEAIEVPRSALRSSTPALPAWSGPDEAGPDEALSTVAVTQRLAARTGLSHSVVFDLTRLLLNSRVALAAETPMAKQIHPPETDTGEALAAALPLHPGAAAYLSGDQNRFFDRYGDLVYIGSMALTGLISGVGALVSFLIARRRQNAAHFTHQLLALLPRARQAHDQAELDAVEHDADRLLALAFERLSSGAIGAEQFDTFATVNEAVQHAIGRRSVQLAAVAPAPPVARDGQD